MNKPWTHHDNWFYILHTIDQSWPYDRHALHVPDKLLKHKWFYHWVDKEKQGYRISYEDTLQYRLRYKPSSRSPARYHISRQFLEKFEFPPEWLKQYNRKPVVDEPDLFNAETIPHNSNSA